MLEPIVTTIEVPCGQQHAFDIFTREMGTWWPLDKRSMSMMHGRKPSKSLLVEPKPGGKIVETGHDGAQYVWGTFRAFGPHDFLSMDFHMGMPAESASLVEVRFTALDRRRTRVQLTQSNWEAFGDLAEMMRGGYGSGWVIIFEQAYHAACSG